MIRDRIQLKHRAIGPARYALDRLRYAIGGTPNQRVRVILVSDGEVYTSEEQFAPFSMYRPQLRDQLGLVWVHLLLRDVLRAPKLILSRFDIIIVKLSFRVTEMEAINAVNIIRDVAPDKQIIYFDGDDDLCIQWPTVLSLVNRYVKKHLFRDKLQYTRKYVGKSNLTDFVHRRHGYSFENDPVSATTVPVPVELLEKLCLGVNLALDRKIISLYNQTQEWPRERRLENDVIFRGSVPKDWTYHLRKDVEPRLGRLGKTFAVLTPQTRVEPQAYYREMLNSKICVSPFGYGEICWRDFEAILCGCLLVKPDVTHVETWPDIFRKYETYIPVEWDYSDLEEKCTYYLTHNDEREEIVAAAFNVLSKFYGSNPFVEWWAQLLRD
jgi:hypothetical protein